MTLRTAAGELFDIDTALRPNGNSGLLVTSIAAFERYQAAAAATPPGPGSTRRSTRARFCAGDAGARRRASRPCARAVLAAPRDPARAARRGAARCATKVRDGAPGAGRAASTSSTAAGGMMDVEFAVQYLVLAHAARAPASCSTTLGNIALLRIAGERG
ncbi:MAG: hypothetical protein MZW92_35545 [Comamonadaceae bacterium]|nr:hypothetical protein [Comamonadaceae bacterium]